MDKSSIRKLLLQKRLSLKKEGVRRSSGKILDKLLNLPEVVAASSVLLYLPVNNEPDLAELVNTLLSRSIQIYLPKYSHNTWGIARFIEMKSLIPGSYGTLQPQGQIVAEFFDVAIVPGVGFDIHGNRLGYGKGVYDRLLASCNSIKIGVSYDFQIVDLPTDIHDVRMDIVVTDERIIGIN